MTNFDRNNSIITVSLLRQGWLCFIDFFFLIVVMR